MNKHTPGPWTNLPRHECIPICRQDEAGLSIGFVHSSSPERIAEGLANAKLIAAAPELLEALEMAMEIGDQCSRGFLGKFQAKARAAIAKATQ